LTRNDQQRLLDIFEAARNLAEISEMPFDDFSSNKLAQRAAERLLEIIGEAANSLTGEFKECHDGIAWQRLISLRHLLAHHYHRVDPDQIWQVLTFEVPNLVENLQRDAR